MIQPQIDSDISNWVFNSKQRLNQLKALTGQIEKCDSSLNDLILVQCRENQILY